jgi:phosphate starvation-inducible protein PhoH and related proteins
MKARALDITLPADNQRLANLCGALDENIRQLEAAYDVAIARRGEHFKLRGEAPQMQRAAQALRRFYEQADKPIEVGQIQLGVIEQTNLEQGAQAPAALLTRKGDLHGRTPRQVEYIRQIQQHDITFGIGPAGTGKTYLAVA